MKWQPMETAPKNGKTILIFDSYAQIRGETMGDDGYGITCARFDRGNWQIHCRNDNIIYCVNPTHWMELPEIPSRDSE